MITTMVCRYEHFCSDWYGRWANTLNYPAGVRDDIDLSYRKIWEWIAILQALDERGFLSQGKKAIGFAVGSEPLASLFAASGVTVFATDLASGVSDERWTATGQHAASLEALYHPSLVERDLFERNVSFGEADMTKLDEMPGGEFDFVWSSCALEHLGTLDAGLDFVRGAMRLLRPGGIAVHTTEYNCSSNDNTIFEGQDVIYRKRDIEKLGYDLRQERSGLEPVDFDAGCHSYDLNYDVQPFFTTRNRHIKLLIEGYVATSCILIAHKG